ncbi:MAG TPA: hypothetical protein VFB52_01610 [Solirubrobacterales bacterium]|nr:hypothetical protein [Solirubrobacterales bacterium]
MSPAEQGLRELIEERKDWYEPMPAKGWRRIAESETTAQFTRGRLDGQMEWFGLELEEDGKWGSNGSSSDCEPTTVLDDVGNIVTWSLARKQKRLTAKTRTLWIDLGPGGCASGAAQNPRAHFRFRTLGNRLLMIAWLGSTPGTHTCQGTIEPPRKVRLPAPLGELRLYDGSTFPPVSAGKTRTRY